MRTATATDFAPVRDSIRRRTGYAALIALLLAGAISFAVAAVSPSIAQAANVSIDQCNNLNGGALGATTGITCDVTVVNVINGGVTRSTVTVTRLCSLEPCPPGNGTFTTRSSNLVTGVTQCNGSGNDAAPPLITCTVTVTNNISADTAGARPVTAATVNQCNGTATGGGLYGTVGPLACDPYPATTSGATVTQCNGSVTGGGSTAACTVGTASRVSPAIPIRVNQCNGTGNKGGTLLTCRTTLVTNITAARSGGGTATASPRATSTGGPQVTRVPGGGVAAGGGGGSTTGPQDGRLFVAGGGLLLAASIGVLFRRRRLAQGAGHFPR